MTNAERPNPSRWVIRAARWLVTLAFVALLWPAQFGGSLGFTVVSGHSMEPGLHTGDLVLTWPAARYAVEDVVVYRVPDGQPGAGGHVVHRIIGGDEHAYRTQGDNRDAPDIWKPTADDITGRVVATMPNAGWVLAFVRSPLFLSGLCAALVVAATLTGSTRSAAKDEREGEDLGESAASAGLPEEPQRAR